jgi:hypothetical protein
LDLKPYGNNAKFVNECTSCHLPVRGNDYVYTLPITLAKVSAQEVVNNAAAALPSNLPYQPLEWGVITMYVDSRNHSMSVLYGSGTVLALVTWDQREDPHWFGARIPNQVQSVEFVQVSGTQSQSGYRRYAGNGLGEEQVTSQDAAQRKQFVLGLSPAPLP